MKNDFFVKFNVFIFSKMPLLQSSEATSDVLAVDKCSAGHVFSA
jgi:hypothetical protein